MNTIITYITIKFPCEKTHEVNLPSDAKILSIERVNLDLRIYFSHNPDMIYHRIFKFKIVPDGQAFDSTECNFLGMAIFFQIDSVHGEMRYPLFIYQVL
jgi:hypothetical protein